MATVRFSSNQNKMDVGSRVFLFLFGLFFSGIGSMGFFFVFVQPLIGKGWSHKLWPGLIPLLFVGVGLAIMGWSVFGGRKSRSLGGSATEIDWLPKPKHRVEGGRIVLRPISSRLGKLVGIILIALFWNGIVSVFVYQAVVEYTKGGTNWFLTIFLIPFVLVGLGLIGAVVYQFMAMFNPKFEFTLDTAELHPGDTVSIGWQIHGAIDRLGKVTVEWIGEESATYQRGTNTHTEKHVFSTQLLYQTEEGAQSVQPRGAVEFLIPLDSMHSFAARNNKISWVLRVRGDISWWPDVKADYPVVVSPRESTTRRSM